MKTLGCITAFFLVVVFTALLNGYTLSILWGWFIVKTFGLPALNVPAAIGVVVIVQYVTIRLDGKKDERAAAELLTLGICAALIKSASALLCGWIVVQFI